MTKEELIKEFEKEFAELKKRLKFKTSLKNLEEAFYLYDAILAEGYVSPRLSRTICRRIVNAFGNWNNYLHNMIMPNPNSMFMVTESQMFTDEERNEIISLMNMIMAHVSKNTMLGLHPDDSGEAKFVDDSFKIWKKTLNPAITKLMKKVILAWEEKTKEPVQPPKHRQP